MQSRLVAGAFAAACTLVLAAPVLQAADQQLADIRIVALVGQADKLSDALRAAEAEQKADEAIALAEKIGDQVGLAMAHRVKGIVLYRTARPREALAWYDKSLAEFDALKNEAGVASVLTAINAASIVLGEFDRARDAAERALALYQKLGDERGRAAILINLVRTELYPPEREEIWLKELLEISARLADDDLRASVLRVQGGGYFTTGNLSGARAAFEEAIVLYDKVGNVESLAASYLNLGRVYRAHGDYEGALQRYQKAIDLLAPTKERFTIVEAVNSSAVALLALDRNKEAIAAYERGLALARESANQRLIDFMEGNLAGALNSVGEYARAVPLLEAAIAKKPERGLLGFRHNSLANALANLGRFDEALVHNTEGVLIARETKNLDSLLPRLDDRAWILASLNRNEEALEASREVVAQTEQIRGRLLPSDFLKRGYGERVAAGYDRMVNLLSRMSRGTEAFEVAEQSRARAFLDLLAARDSGSPPPAAPAGAPAATEPGRTDVGSDALGKPLNAAGVRDLAKRLGSTVVTYWVSTEATVVWIARPAGEPAHVRLTVPRTKLESLVAGTTALMRESPSDGATRGAEAAADDLTALPMRGLGLLALSRDNKAAWRELYKTLVEPIRAHLPSPGGRITIVPHGPLFHLSFAALQSSAGRYLIEDYELHYAPAASALEFTGRRQKAIADNPAGPWAIVGNPAALPVVRDKPLPPLPGAAREIAAIAAIAPRGRALRLDGVSADERALATMLDTSRPSVLHFATHGFVFDDPKQPPFLALNRRGTTDSDDGRLTLDEVYRLHLVADLVVLSACRTGSGRVSADGVVGLTRGFFHAGTPTVLATFWDVTDETTANLMSAFYRGYVKARAKGASLRAAQLALLQDLRAGRVVVTAAGRRVTLPEHPLLWAAFFLSGEP